MNSVNALAGGLLGALIGGIAWVAFGYFTGYELGILAVGVGITSGIGVAMGAKGKAGTEGGILAAACAMLAIVGARYVLVQFEIDDMIREAAAGYENAPGPEDGDYWTAFLADRIVSEREEAGMDIEWPDDDDAYEDDVQFNDYPTDVWAEASNQWDAVPVSERHDFCKAATQLLATENVADMEDYRTTFSIIGVLFSNLHPMALLIMGIAMAGAFKIARDSKPANESAPEVMNFDATQPSGLPGMPAAKPTGSTGFMHRALPSDPLDMPRPNMPQSRATVAPPPSTSAPTGLPGMPPPGSLHGNKDRFTA
jgi:hypothetical protein